MNKPVYIASKKSGHSHPKCYLSHTKGCSEKISGEHYLSKALLNVIEKQNKTIDVTGLSWLPKEQLSSISKKTLTANILCVDHNSALSPLDTKIAELVSAIGDIDLELQKQEPSRLVYSVDGAAIERWLIKMVYGLVVSGQIAQKSGQPFVVKDKCMSLLCSPNERWPAGWGLYLARPRGRVFHSSSFELIPQHNPDTGHLLLLAVKFNGFAMNFVMGRPADKHEVGFHRPAGLKLIKGDTSCTIIFKWSSTQKTGGEMVTFTHGGTYTGPAPGQDLPRAS